MFQQQDLFTEKILIKERCTAATNRKVMLAPKFLSAPGKICGPKEINQSDNLLVISTNLLQ